MSIVEFLRARLDEDERIAHNALGLLGMETRWYDQEELRHRGLTRADAMHVARHSSRRVLREVEAKRGIITEIESRDDFNPEMWGMSRLAVRVLLALAAVYADHPDYQPDWT